MQIVQERPYTYRAMAEDIQALLHVYPSLNKRVIGRSVFGKELMVLTWGEGPKRIFINGAHHGMEWITALLLTRFSELCGRFHAAGESIGETNFKDVYKKVTLAICPMVNPDGVDLCIQGLTEDISPLAKTRLTSYNNGSQDFSRWQANANGVDLNHNYDAAFLQGVATAYKEGIVSPGPTRFSGNTPESEPESYAIAEFTREFMPHIAVAYHTQGEVIYYDFEKKATDLSKRMVEDLCELSGYSPDETEGMASFSGYKDWVIKDFSIPAFTIEAGLGKNPLPLSQFSSIWQKNLPMLLYLLRK